MSLYHAPVTSTPTAAHTVSRYLMDLSQRPHNSLVLTVLVSINDASSVLHFRSASWYSTDNFSIAFSTYAQYHGVWPQHLWVFCNLFLQTDCGRPTSISWKALLFSYYIPVSYSIQDTLCDKLLTSILDTSFDLCGWRTYTIISLEVFVGKLKQLWTHLHSWWFIKRCFHNKRPLLSKSDLR